MEVKNILMHPVTVHEVAQTISPGLAKAALAGQG